MVVPGCQDNEKSGDVHSREISVLHGYSLAGASEGVNEPLVIHERDENYSSPYHCCE
jgi:hypothetical protein